MVASSEQQRAPVIVNKPATVHPRSNQPGAPLSRDDSAEVIKIPEPIIEPITIMVASIGPSARTRLVSRRLIDSLPSSSTLSGLPVEVARLPPAPLSVLSLIVELETARPRAEEIPFGAAAR